MNSSLLDALFPACIALELYRATVGDYQAQTLELKRGNPFIKVTLIVYFLSISHVFILSSEITKV